MQFLGSAETIKQNFTQELRDAAAGKKTSLRFIKHQLPTEKLVKNDEVFQVMVFGGTVFTKALVKKVNNKAFVLKKHHLNHPALSTKEMFLEFLAKQIHPQVNTLGINFAFPLSPAHRHDRMDGVLLSATKSKNTFSGLIDKLVGQAVEDYIFQKSNKLLKVSIANDAICLLLSGIDKFEANNLTGAILGTGTNTALFYNDFAVNVQSGGFDKFTPSPECLYVDEKSPVPKASLFEKETAGGYLYKQFNYLLRKRMFNYPLISSTKELYEIMQNNQETEIATLAMTLFEKSAALMAGQITGLAEFKKHDLNLIIEGSMYWDNHIYQTYFEKYLGRLSSGNKIELKRVEDSSILGAVNLAA